jgi:hypothetical protein
MRLLLFLNETSNEQDIENVLDALRNVPTGHDPRTEREREEDKDDNRTYLNPLPSLTLHDPKFADWYDRGDDIIFDYVNEKGWDRREGAVRALNALGTKTTVPINKLIGAERYLDPRGLQRKASAKFSSKLPIVYKVDGNLFIVDGNHRVVQAHLAGKTEVEVIMLDVNSLEQVG